MGLASFFAAISPSFELLLFFRINQAIAGGLIVPNAIAQLREFGPAATRGRSFGLVAAAIGVATGIGACIAAGVGATCLTGGCVLLAVLVVAGAHRLEVLVWST